MSTKTQAEDKPKMPPKSPMGYTLPEGLFLNEARLNSTVLFLKNLVNVVTVPLRLIIPQPLLAKAPLLRTNAEERFGQVMQYYTGRALDIGCGSNWLIRQYRLAGGEGLGVDVYDWGGADLIVEDSSHLDLSSASFDSVSIVAALNHIPNRAEVLKEANRLLKPGGRLILTNLTPTISLIWHKVAFWDADSHERHMEAEEVWGFTEAQLCTLANEAGFTLVSKKGFMWKLNHVYIFSKS